MSKINSTSQKQQDNRLAGGFGNIAAKQSNENTLRRLVLSNMLWEDIAYVNHQHITFVDGLSVTDQIISIIPLCDGKTVADIAVESRMNQKLRHIPLFLAAEMCKHEHTRKYVADVLDTVITRADMITDFIAIYWRDGKCPLCRQAIKGLSRAFHHFDEYQFAKYDRNTPIKLRDAMFLVHPKPQSDEETELFKRIANRTMATPDTWEVALSSGADKRETFTRLIDEHKLGAMAMMRNLRNMCDVGVDSQTIINGIRNANGSMLLPLDYYKAYVNSPDEYRDVIDEKMVSSYGKLPKLPGHTLFILDVSGSMRMKLSSKSQFTRMDAAYAMAILAANQCEKCTFVATAGNDWSREHSTSIVEVKEKGFANTSLFNEYYKELGGGGIFTRQCLEWCAEQLEGQQIDRIIVFSDSQDCDIVNVKPSPFGTHNYICDVSSNIHGVNYKGVWDAEITGFSDHFITYIAALEGIENKFENE